MFDYPAVPVLSWSPLAELSGLIDVTVTASFAAPLLTVTVTQDCDNLPVVGLVQGDFTVLNSSGAEQLPADSFVNNLDGTYTFTFNSLLPGAYTVDLKTPANQLTGGYQSGSSVSFSTAFILINNSNDLCKINTTNVLKYK
jgi:predicted extracellular nuclease